MTFIIVFISLLIERFFHWSQLRHWRWSGHYQHWLSVRMSRWPSYFLLTAILLPPVLVVGLINCALSGWWHNLIKLIFDIAVLTYCLGPANLWVRVYSSIAESQKEDPKETIFIAANERIFAVLFWFVLLGPVGAVLYRLVILCGNSALQLRHVLDWLPVRVFTFIFALGGHFTEVMVNWKKDVFQGLSSNEKLLADCGAAALGLRGRQLPEDGSAEKEVLALLDRVFVMVLVMLAVVVLLT